MCWLSRQLLKVWVSKRDVSLSDLVSVLFPVYNWKAKALSSADRQLIETRHDGHKIGDQCLGGIIHPYPQAVCSFPLYQSNISAPISNISAECVISFSYLSNAETCWHINVPFCCQNIPKTKYINIVIKLKMSKDESTLIVLTLIPLNVKLTSGTMWATII